MLRSIASGNRSNASARLIATPCTSAGWLHSAAYMITQRTGRKERCPSFPFLSMGQHPYQVQSRKISDAFLHRKCFGCGAAKMLPPVVDVLIEEQHPGQAHFRKSALSERER
eukprot:1159973-Pelagomonas_calceolata.AAC.7